MIILYNNRGILNEIEIIKRMLHQDPDKRIVITPLIDPKTQINPSSVDLRLGTHFKISRSTKFTHIEPLDDPKEIRKKLAHYTEDVHLDPSDYFVLHPFEFVLGTTLEFIKLPYDIAARLEGRSSWGRIGLQIHSTAGFVDPGYKGTLTFELENIGKSPIKLYPGIRIAQISFYYLTDETKIPYPQKKSAKYAGSIEAKSSSFYEDPEFEILRNRNIPKEDKSKLSS